jgi:hypothetical protein
VSVDLNEYLKKRIEELTTFKSETLNSLKDISKTVEELSFEEGNEILEKQMKFYIATGALAELKEVKRALSGK